MIVLVPVIPAQAGIQSELFRRDLSPARDPRLRGDDGVKDYHCPGL